MYQVSVEYVKVKGYGEKKSEKLQVGQMDGRLDGELTYSPLW